jgi:hypothetical protein
MRCVATIRLIQLWLRPILSTIMFLTETGASLREAFWCDSTDASRDHMDQNYRFCSFGFHPRLRSRTPTLLRNGGSRLCKENHGVGLEWGDTRIVRGLVLPADLGTQRGHRTQGGHFPKTKLFHA